MRRLAVPGAAVTTVLFVGAPAAKAAQDQGAPDQNVCAPPANQPQANRPHRFVAAAVDQPVFVGEQVPPEGRAHVPIELTMTAGYAFATGVPVAGGAVAFDPSPIFGASVDIGDWYGLRLELSYMLQEASLEFEPNTGDNQYQYDVTVHHFQIGGEFDILRTRVRPFIGLVLGAAWFSPHSPNPDELWLEGSLEAGAKMRITRLFGLRAQVVVTSTAMDSRSQIFCGNGCYSSWYGIGTSQLAMMAGPTLKF
jgi:hypothetical protein